MIVSSFSDYPNWLSQKLFSGNFNAVCMAYRFPASIHYEDKIYVVRERAELVRVLATFQAILSHYKLAKVSTEVQNSPEWTAKRFEVLVDQTYDFELGESPQHCRMKFFVERRGLRPAIRKVEVEKLPFGKQIVKQRAVRSLEAEAPVDQN